ncbi:hypothetical protein BH24ACT21_BH24ACT21_00640 [soil metagenome]|jgi:hypothetical protein
MIFVISDNLGEIERIEAGSFVSLDVWERTHIQEWVRRHPEILGEDLLIVSMEFDRFKGSRDRLDLLAVDRRGNLVVVELKRNSHADYADLQSIRYAAMVSTMTVEQLLPYYAEYHKTATGAAATEEELRSNIANFVELEEFEEFSSHPRIILCSEDFSQEISTTVLWLREFDLDIACVRFTPHCLEEDKIILVPEKIIPLRETEQYVVGIQEKEEKRQDATKGKVAATLEELLDRADRNGTGEGFRAILESAEKYSDIGLRCSQNGLAFTPAANRTWTLFVMYPLYSSGEGLEVNVYSEVWAHWFGVTKEAVGSTLGPERYRKGVTNEEAKEFAANLDRMFEHLGQSTD